MANRKGRKAPKPVQIKGKRNLYSKITTWIAYMVFEDKHWRNLINLIGHDKWMTSGITSYLYDKILPVNPADNPVDDTEVAAACDWVAERAGITDDTAIKSDIVSCARGMDNIARKSNISSCIRGLKICYDCKFRYYNEIMDYIPDKANVGIKLIDRLFYMYRLAKEDKLSARERYRLCKELFDMVNVYCIKHKVMNMREDSTWWSHH